MMPRARKSPWRASPKTLAVSSSCLSSISYSLRVRGYLAGLENPHEDGAERSGLGAECHAPEEGTRCRGGQCAVRLDVDRREAACGHRGRTRDLNNPSAGGLAGGEA